MARTDWEKLIERYADGKPICNCRNAYYTPSGEGLVCENGVCVRKTGMMACEYGCSANQLGAKEYIAKRVLSDLKD